MKYFFRNVVGKVGPVSVDICFHDSLHHYKGDIYDQADCCAHNSDRHAPVVVGYGTDKKHGDYWIIKNSWGFLKANFYNFSNFIFISDCRNKLGKQRIREIPSRQKHLQHWSLCCRKFNYLIFKIRNENYFLFSMQRLNEMFHGTPEN